jgi:hypothetical protein
LSTVDWLKGLVERDTKVKPISQRVWKWEEEAKEKLKQKFRGRVRLKKTYVLSMLKRSYKLAHGCN